MLFIITLFIHGLETNLYWSAIHGIKHSDEKKKNNREFGSHLEEIKRSLL